MNKTFTNAYNLKEDIAQNHYQLGSEHFLIEKTQSKCGSCKVSNFDHINVKVDMLYQNQDNLTITPTTTAAS